MSQVRIEKVGDRIHCRFEYSKPDVDRVRTIPGRAYRGTTNDKYWSLPLDMTVCRKLRKLFGDRLDIGLELDHWARQAVRQESQLGALALADTGTLERLQHVLPALYRAIHLGPLGLQMTPAEADAAMQGPGSYQAADVAFLSKGSAHLNANQQGLGKTIETIAAVWEGGRELGSHLIIAPSAAVDGVWEDELIRWQEGAPVDVEVFAITGTRAKREAKLAAYQASTAPVRWVIVNPQMIAYRKDPTRTSDLCKILTGKAADLGCRCGARKKPHEHYESTYPLLHETHWNSIIPDEIHKGNIRNHKTITAWAMNDLKLAGYGWKCALSGTPMKKKGADIWGTLHWLRPDVFTSYWNFAANYFEIEDNGFGKRVLELLPDAEPEFFKALTPYVLRRLKSECLPWLPPKHYVDVWCQMEGRQAKLYKEMVLEGAARLSEVDNVTTTSILAELTRLRQFATAVWKMKDGKLVPTEESCKLEALLEKMDEADMFDPDCTDKQVVFSQSREVIEMVAHVLSEKGLEVEIISGKVNKEGERKAIKERFQKGSTRVLCIVTTAGGVALTLDAASVAHFIDEMHSPDEKEQAEDRIHRASRKHQVTIYTYRSRGTVDEAIQSISEDKARAHAYILDHRRQMMKAA